MWRAARAIAVAAVCGAVACSPAAPPASPPPAAAPDPALPAHLVGAASGSGARAHLVELQRIADAHGGNRAVGTAGYDASVEYVAGVLRGAGYDVTTPPFAVRRFTVAVERLTAGADDVPVVALRFSPATPAGGLTAPLAVPAQDETSGCEASDFTGVPSGAVVLLWRGTCPFTAKVANAARAGAGAVLVASTEGGPLDGATLDPGVGGLVPSASVGRADADALAARPGTEVRLDLATATETTGSRNVVAQTRTGDPGRVLLAGGHLDSVPDGPGINDNGSGVAALLETAVRLGGSPAVRHAVRFAFWGAEEVGLVGSTEYVAALSDDDRARIALYLNLDMVASPNPGYFVHDGDDSDGAGAGPGPPGSAGVERVLVDGLIAAGAPPAGTDFDGRSDYGPFVAAGIPSGGIFTGAGDRMTPEQAQRWGGTAGAPFDACYHRACDRLDNVDDLALDRSVDALAAAVGRFALALDDLGR